MQDEGGESGEYQPADPAHADPSHADAVDPADVAACLRVLGRLADNPALGDGLAEVGKAVARVYKRVGKDRRWRAERRAERERRQADRARAEATGRCRQDPRPAALLAAGVPTPPDDSGLPELANPRACYVCKEAYRRLHSFYHMLCPDCAADNYARRSARADLTGRRALRHRRADQDRLPGRPHAPAGRGRGDRHHPLPPRRRRAVRPRG